MHDLQDRFGQVLRNLRREYRWSQEELAGRAGLNRCYLGEIERGEAVPSLATLTKLATALDLSPSTIIALCENSDS